MYKLQQDNEKIELQTWRDFQMPVTTGPMSDCISIVFLDKNKQQHYGIHCGGGVNEEEAKRLKDCLPDGFKIDKTIVAFGFNYYNNFSCLFSADDAYRIFGDDTIILSDETTIYSSISYKAKYEWDRVTGSWKNLLNNKSSKSHCTIL